MLREVEAIVLRELRHPQGAPAGDDGDLLQRVGTANEIRHQSVTAFMYRHPPLVLVAQRKPTAGAQDDLVVCRLEVALGDPIPTVARCGERRFVDHVGKIRAREARRPAGETIEINFRRHGPPPGVKLEDGKPAIAVRQSNLDPAIEPARTQQSRVENIRPVGCRDDDDALALLEAVHLDQQLVKCLLALVVATDAHIAGPLSADGVDLVHEDDARRNLLRLFEKVANSSGTDADEHLHELGGADREERDLRLARDRACHQSLAGAGRPRKKDAVRDSSADLGVARRLPKVIDDLLEVFLGLLIRGDVGEGDVWPLLRVHAGAALADSEPKPLAGPRLVRDRAKEQKHEHDAQRVERVPKPLERGLCCAHLHVVVEEELDQAAVTWRLLGQKVRIASDRMDELTGDLAAEKFGALDIVRLDLGDEVTEGDHGLRPGAAEGEEHVEREDKRQEPDPGSERHLPPAVAPDRLARARVLPVHPTSPGPSGRSLEPSVGLFKGISKRTDTVFKSAARLATMRWHPLSRSR